MKLLTINKEGLLWAELLNHLNEVANSYKFKNQNKILPFPAVFEAICRKCSIKKAKAWECLFFLSEFGLIEVVRFHGIKLNYKVKK